MLTALFALTPLWDGHAAEDDRPPSLQEMRMAGQVLGFLDVPLSGLVNLAVVFNSHDPRSRVEASAIGVLLADRTAVGAVTLQPVLVEQSHLADMSPCGAIFAANGVDPKMLKKELALRHLPCLTRHLDQIEQGACMVALQTFPSINIVINELNASSAGVRFATAFRMMVQEL